MDLPKSVAKLVGVALPPLSLPVSPPLSFEDDLVPAADFPPPPVFFFSLSEEIGGTDTLDVADISPS
jgi:hypothetical protein